MWWKKYRILLLVYTVALGMGVREFLVTREKDPFGWLSPEGQDLMGILAEVNPSDPENDFLQGMKALSAGDADEYFRRMERAYAANIKHNEMFLRSYAQSLLDGSGDWPKVNRAVNRWRQNFPFSQETLALPLPTDKRFDHVILERALEQIPWVADSRVVHAGPGTGEEGWWQVEILFRRGQVVDMRDALAATEWAALP